MWKVNWGKQIGVELAQGGYVIKQLPGLCQEVWFNFIVFFVFFPIFVWEEGLCISYFDIGTVSCTTDNIIGFWTGLKSLNLVHLI